MTAKRFIRSASAIGFVVGRTGQRGFARAVGAMSAVGTMGAAVAMFIVAMDAGVQASRRRDLFGGAC